MEFGDLKNVVEAILFASDEPVSLTQLTNLLAEEFEEREQCKIQIQQTIDELTEECSKKGIELVEVASGLRYQMRSDLNHWMHKLWKRRPPRYSRALLETLAIIAYRQPVTRGDIESLRGVGVGSSTMRTLQERGWIRELGTRPVPGRPTLYGTSRAFLDYFNLKSLHDLPPIQDIEALVEREEPTVDEIQSSTIEH